MVTNDIAHRLTDISTSIMTTPDYNTLEEASDLLAKSQSEILSNLIEPWIEFDKTYKNTTSSPTHSSISKAKKHIKLTIISTNNCMSNEPLHLCLKYIKRSHRSVDIVTVQITLLMYYNDIINTV